MTASLSGVFSLQEFTDASVAGLGMRLYTYTAGTTTFKTAYTDSAGLVPHTYTNDGLGGQYIALNARGELPAPLYLTTGSYDICLKRSDGSTVWTRKADPIGDLSVAIANQTDPSQGAGQIGLYDSLAPSFLKVTSDLLQLNEVSILRFIDRAKWSGIAAGTNADDLSSNWNTAMAAASAKGLHLFVPPGLHNANNIAVLSDYTQIRGVKGATLKSTVAGHHILEAVGRTGVKLEGIKFQGLGSSTMPVATVGGYEAKGTGLVDFAACTDVSVRDCELSDFYTLLAAVKCSQVVLERNNVHNWYLFGVLASLSNYLRGVGNFVHDSDFAGAGNSYCFSATGDMLNGSPESGINWSHNFMWNCPAWDAVMCHEVNNFTAIANQIWNVRVGFDLTASLVTNVFTNIILALNNIRATTTDTWAGAAAQHAGIFCQGFDAAHPMSGLQLVGNIVDGFYNAAGLVNGGNTANIALTNTKNAVATGNVVKNAGGAQQNAGYLIVGACDGLNINGGSLQGSMASGGVRFAGATGAAVQVGGISVVQTTTTDPVVQSTTSTLTGFSLETNPSNSTVPFTQTGSTITSANSGTFSGSITGCTSSVTGNIEWALNGNQVTLTIPTITGTSVSNALTITGLPGFLQPFVSTVVCPVSATNNGAYTANVTASISPGSGVITYSIGGSPTGWTNSSTKGPVGSTITYSL